MMMLRPTIPDAAKGHGRDRRSLLKCFVGCKQHVGEPSNAAGRRCRSLGGAPPPGNSSARHRAGRGAGAVERAPDGKSRNGGNLVRGFESPPSPSRSGRSVMLPVVHGRSSTSWSASLRERCSSTVRWPNFSAESADVNGGDHLAEDLRCVAVQRDLRVEAGRNAEREVGHMTTVDSVRSSSAWTITA